MVAEKAYVSEWCIWKIFEKPNAGRAPKLLDIIHQQQQSLRLTKKYSLEKLRYPLMIDGWNMNFPFKMLTF